MKLITVICTALMAFSLTACAQKLEKMARMYWFVKLFDKYR